MAYSDIAMLQADMDFSMRTTACAATESIPDPRDWAVNHTWEMAATPSFGEKYASALAANIPRPGWDPSVISDGDILAAVQAIGTGNAET